MASSLTSKHIPTILGVLVLIAGLVGGIFLANSATTGFLPRASAETTPKNIKITNVSDSSFTVSWITDSKTTGYVKYGATSSNLNLTITDDRDQISGSTGTFRTHHVTIRGLSPNTAYYYKLGSSSNFLYDNNGQPYSTTTVSSISSNAKTVYGQILTSAQSGVGGVIVYISGDDMAPLSAISQSSGSFVLSLSQARTKNLNSQASLLDSTVLSIFAQGEGDTATSLVQAKLDQAQPLPEIVLGTNQDLTKSTADVTTTPSPTPTTEELKSKFTAQLLAPPTETTVSAQLLTITAPSTGDVLTIKKPVFSGTAAKSSKITLSLDGPTTLTASVTSTSLGKWTYTSSKSLTDGSYTFTANSTNAGKAETSTATFSVSVPTPSPRVIAAATESALPVSGTQEFSVLLGLAGLLFVASGVSFSLAKTTET